MNDTLKVAGRIGAELGAAKAENEAMRILLRESYSELLVMKTEVGFRGKTLELIDRIDAFLSRQPEPTDTYTAVDMATAAAQGFRDGQAAMEPAPAQDERTAFEAWVMQHNTAVREDYDDTDENAPEDIRLDRQGGVYIWANAEAAWFAWKARSALDTRPAQTEQQPIRMPPRPEVDVETAENLKREDGYFSGFHEGAREMWDDISRMNSAPIAQTAPQGKFSMGDLVKKSTGSEWEGRVVGWYSTEQTKEGYAVESSAHRNSVQIYPVTALEAVE